MACFQDLPNELLCQLLKIIMPEDLGNFAQINKHLQLLSQPLLINHRRLVRKYSNSIRNGRGWIADTLRETLNNPYIGQYFRRLRIDNVVAIGVTNFDWAHSAKDQELFVSAAMNSEFFASVRGNDCSVREVDQTYGAG